MYSLRLLFKQTRLERVFKWLARPPKLKFTVLLIMRLNRDHSGRNSRSELRSPPKSPGNTEVPSFKTDCSIWGEIPRVCKMVGATCVVCTGVRTGRGFNLGLETRSAT
jgi:hypothetical protein